MMSSSCLLQTLSLFFSSSNSLFSTIITLYTLILLYIPCVFFHFIFSSILITSTIILLLFLLRLRASQNSQSPPELSINLEAEANPAPDPKTKSYSEDESFVEWDVRAPLEVIYEEYDQEDNLEENKGTQVDDDDIIQRYASLSRFYPESDSDDSSSSEDENNNMCFFEWEDESDREGLIEIALDYDDQKKKRTNTNNNDLFLVDEDNLIEINL